MLEAVQGHQHLLAAAGHGPGTAGAAAVARIQVPPAAGSWRSPQTPGCPAQRGLQGWPAAPGAGCDIPPPHEADFGMGRA